MYSEPSPKAKMQTMGVVLMLVSCVMAAYLWLVHSESLWPSTAATVKSFDCVYYSSPPTRRYRSRQSGYRLVLKYEYRAGEGLYTSESEMGRYSDKNAAAEVGNKQIGTQALIHYSPSNPSTTCFESVLAQNRPIAGLVLIAMAACAIVGGVMVVSSRA